MKLLFVVETAPEIGGGEHFMLRLAQAMSDRGHEVTIRARWHNPLIDTITVPTSLTSPFTQPFKGAHRLMRLVDRVGDRFLPVSEDTYIVGYLRDAAIRAVDIALRSNNRSVNFIFENPQWMAEDLGTRWDDEYRGRFKDSWRRAAQAYHDTDILLSISKTAAAKASSWLSRPVTGVVSPGTSASSRHQISRRHILSLCRLDPYKNVDIILRAYALLKGDLPLVVVGDGPERPRLEALADDLGIDVEFVGTVDEQVKERLIAQAACLVFPSSHEGFGMPPLEALARGVPVVVTDREVLREVCGRHAIYVGDRDIRGTVEGIRKALHTRIPKTVAASYRRRFTWENAARSMEAALNG